MQNPNGEGSGVVNFSIAAINARSYRIDFEMKKHKGEVFVEIWKS